MQTEAKESPYVLARREWNERYGDYVKAAATWKLFAFIALSLGLLSVGGLIYIGSQSKLVPYVIETESSGRIISAGFPEKVAVSGKVILANLSDWVRYHRSVVVDPTVQRLYLDRTYAYILQNSPAKEMLDRWYVEGHDPFARMEKGSVTVEVESVLLLSGKTYQIEWREASIDRNGQTLGEPERFRALLTLENRDVDSNVVLKNPLGIFIATISTQKL